jgi:alkanesulfonate monooxygenase SsuD/methylene tetrahydromethanopterin reductase-like flavin-dependent oxidoreductase (luciferase family)
VQVSRVPFAIAGYGRQSMVLAAKFGETWITAGDWRADEQMSTEASVVLVHEQIDRLNDACAMAGRQPDSLGRMVVTGPSLASGMGSLEEFRDAIGRYVDAGVTDLAIHWPASGSQNGDLSKFETLISSK